jgi:hypothetical protein
MFVINYGSVSAGLGKTKARSWMPARRCPYIHPEKVAEEGAKGSQALKLDLLVGAVITFE